MKALFKSLLIPILSLLCMALGSGLFTTFALLRLELEGASATVIGLAASSFNAGILAGAFLSPRFAIQLGCARALVVIYALNTGVILLHAVWIDAWVWVFLRFLSGVLLGGFFTVMESWFLKASLPSTRSQALSLYLIAYYLAVSLGQLLLGTTDPLLLSIFFLSAAFSASAMIPLLTGGQEAPSFEPKQISLLPSGGRFHFGFFCGIASGIVLASVHGLVPLYGKAVGLTLGQISLLMCVIISGGFLFQWPLGKWGDAAGHGKALRTVCFAAMLAALSVGAIGSLSFPWLLLLCWLFGGASFALYPLSLAAICDGIPEERLPNTVGKFVAAYSVGAVLGPLGTSFCIAQLGASGLFYFLGAICALSGLIASKKNNSRFKPPSLEG